MEGGGYIADAKANGGVWYETPEENYKVIGKEAAWETNEAFLRQQMEAGTPKLEFVGTDVDSELAAFEGKAGLASTHEGSRNAIPKQKRGELWLH